MILTRRDALVGLLLGGGVWAGTVGVDHRRFSEKHTSSEDKEIDESEFTVLTAVAEVVYPSVVTPTRGFVVEYIGTLPAVRQKKIATTVRALDKYVYQVRGERLPSLEPESRSEVLRAMGVDRSGAAPEGTLPERIRYYVVDQLLYGLYTSPRGGKLLGIENPVGHPGGFQSYQKPPSDVDSSAIAEPHARRQTDE